MTLRRRAWVDHFLWNNTSRGSRENGRDVCNKGPGNPPTRFELGLPTNGLRHRIVVEDPLDTFGEWYLQCRVFQLSTAE